MEDEPSRQVVTFIVRVGRDPSGRLRGTVERARTGEKRLVTGAPAIGRAIDEMLGRDPGTEARRSRRGRGDR